VDDLEHRVRAFLHEHAGLPLDISLGADVVSDHGVYGDDLSSLMDTFAERFAVRIDGFRWYHHTGPEGCNPLWLLVKPWWARMTRVPIRVGDLVESARRGVWCVTYPPDEAEGKDHNG
jgi:hypothetical protein